jgi:sugar O-acyltransferase (sialic acid O-acetyltransferase NeuD family)
VKKALSEVEVVVYGASGHGKVVADILQALGIEIAGFVDDNPLKTGELFGLQILGDGDWLAEHAARRPVSVAFGIGDNFARRAIMDRCNTAGARPLTAVHPSATVAPSATLAPGAVVMAQAVVNADAVIGHGAIINTGAIVEHDCHIGDFAHLSPKVAIGGHTQIGDFAWLGIGSTAIHGVKVGTGSIVGAGATVLTDIGEWVVAIGTPARIFREITPRI